MICISIGHQDFETCNSLIEKYEFAEIRLDLCNFSKKQNQQLFNRSKKMLATYLVDIITFESKAFTELIDAIDLGASMIDINIRWDMQVIKELIYYARKNSVDIIGSYHNFEMTPSKYELKEIIENIEKYDVDYKKVATNVCSVRDSAKLISLYDSNYHNLIVIGLGELGRIVRLASMKLGAPFTFASIDDKHQTASNQINYNDLTTMLNLL